MRRLAVHERMRLLGRVKEWRRARRERRCEDLANAEVREASERFRQDTNSGFAGGGRGGDGPFGYG